MNLLEHEGFVFKNILSGGYNIIEDEEQEVTSKIMGDGSERRNYYPMNKTYIEIKFGQLSLEKAREYLKHFKKAEDIYTYYSIDDNVQKTKKFRVEKPKKSLLSSTKNGRIKEFTIKLSQIGEV